MTSGHLACQPHPLRNTTAATSSNSRAITWC